MTHEFKNIVDAYIEAKQRGKSCVIATEVDLEGSSYRRPGVSMLITESGNMIGAVSGGCVEKDVLRQAQSVFETGKPKMMTYEGKFKLGCEGTLYILIEPFKPNKDFIASFYNFINNRNIFSIESYYSRNIGEWQGLGSFLLVGNKRISFNAENIFNEVVLEGLSILKQEMPPMFQLIVFGAEYDAARLTKQASLLGWQVKIVTTPFDCYSTIDFPGSDEVIRVVPEGFNTQIIDRNTGVVLMTHNYAKDLNYLLAIKDTNPIYLGMLGPARRRDKLLEDLMDRVGGINESLLDVIHGPAGLNLGSETAEEIALAICSEIIAVQRGKDATSLKNINAEIHN